MKIRDNVIFRFEPNYKSGVLFIFDLDKYKTYEGGKNEYIILNYIEQNDQCTVDQIIKSLEEIYQIDNYNFEQIHAYIYQLNMLGIIEL